MQPHGWTALPATAPAPTQTAALVEERQVLFILLRSSLWEEGEQSSGSPEGITHTLPTAHLGSAGPSCLWQQRCGGITASSCVTVPCLCWDTAAVVQVCCKPFNGQQAATDTELQDSPGGLQLWSCSHSGCIPYPSMSCSHRGQEQRSSYPISSALSEEEEYRKLQIFSAAFPPCPSVIAIGGFLSLFLDASEQRIGSFPWVFAAGRIILALELDQRPTEGSTEGLST